MVARKVVVRLKPNSLAEFTELMECEIVPWLRKQEGFLGLTILPVPEGSEVATISFWDQKWSVQAYNSSGYPEVLKILAKLMDGVPCFETFDVASSTFQRNALPQPPEPGNLVQPIVVGRHESPKSSLFLLA